MAGARLARASSGSVRRFPWRFPYEPFHDLRARRRVKILVGALLRPERSDRVVREARREAEQVDARHRRRHALVADAVRVALREDELHFARDRALELREAIRLRERAVVD